MQKMRKSQLLLKILEAARIYNKLREEKSPTGEETRAIQALIRARVEPKQMTFGGTPLTAAVIYLAEQLRNLGPTSGAEAAAMSMTVMANNAAAWEYYNQWLRNFGDDSPVILMRQAAALDTTNPGRTAAFAH